MNFVDVQPKSFLDYAWTTPSSSSTIPTKPSKTSRKQNRCCDQCRKGKRACDAAILEDTLLDINRSGAGNPTVFHYSDVFGPLSPCANCEKTKKKCTFEWLRSQRVSQAAPQTSTTPPAKRRRTKSDTSNSSEGHSDIYSELLTIGAPQSTTLSGTASMSDEDFVIPTECVLPADLGLTFADFPAGMPLFDLTQHDPLLFESDNPKSNGVNSPRMQGLLESRQLLVAEDDLLARHDSAQEPSLETSCETSCRGLGPESSHISESEDDPPMASGAIMRIHRKRRRRSSLGSVSNDKARRLTFPLTSAFFSSTNRAFLTENLLKVYHDSFENAISCWLTERTCPYGRGSDVSLANDAGPDWNRIYHRVFRLDRLASPIRGRNLTHSEDQAASRAINLAIVSFASQWAQSGSRSKARYPFHNDESDDKRHSFGTNGDIDVLLEGNDFDRELQISTWHQARAALQAAAEIESFRVVLAQIVFSITQKPAEIGGEKALKSEYAAALPMPEEDCYVNIEMSQPNRCNVGECEDLMSKLDLTMDGEGPPVHLEQGLRLIHSLRSKMAMTASVKKAPPRCGKPPRRHYNRLDETDRATVDLLFWLGVMFDTLSSAMHKRPLVVSDEDSDIYSNGPRQAIQDVYKGRPSPGPTRKSGGLWDDYLFARQQRRTQSSPARWPCSYAQASSLLCDAAPIKVLLFRKVTRLQTLLSRNVQGAKIEEAIGAALEVHDHWERLYTPFLRDCRDNHDGLPPRIQSWYICLSGHWLLATLLLADLVEIIDDSESSITWARTERISKDFVARFRVEKAQALSDLARCACPRVDATFSRSREFHFALNEGALLTEPWTAVLIRAFAKAGVVLLESESSPPAQSAATVDQDDAFRRADDCVKALWYLGRKSDMALSAAKILGDALRERRRGVEEKVNDMSSFLEAQMWDGFEGISGAFEVECV